MESIDNLVEQLGSNDQVKAFQARQALERMVAQAGQPGHGQERAAVAAALAGHLTATGEQKDRQGKTLRVPQHSAKVRREVARGMSYVAGEAEVPALKQALADLDTREMARWALEQIPGPAATKALIDAAVDGIGVEFRVGAINSLGRRNGPEAASALKQCATDPSAEVRLAAVEALANYPDPTADAVIKAAMNSGDEVSPRAVRRLSRARIRLAETLVTAGQKDAGKRIYKAILAGKVDESQKKAARLSLQQLG